MGNGKKRRVLWTICASGGKRPVERFSTPFAGRGLLKSSLNPHGLQLRLLRDRWIVVIETAKPSTNVECSGELNPVKILGYGAISGGNSGFC
jgi:hypothetical protein